ncbi:uncharacterized protein LOC120358366 [Solenopsis invicta]|uniref:uncharacterized protein LOC120358366 n=1 Tax=Solenopsis invicta TaxID=13686 RepID=UPI00193DD1B9|nr:uncharacterized protein LOC120358366 [Solenopsis invicta]
MKVWTMRFESKHRFFKRAIRYTLNFTNVPKSLSIKHELLQSFVRLGTDIRIQTEFYEVSNFYIELYNKDIQKAIQNAKLPQMIQQCSRVVVKDRKMPLFKVESLSHKRIMIKANSISEIIEIAIKKLKLPEDNTYKLLLQNDGTEIDDNDVLLEYAEQSKDMIVLTILDSSSISTCSEALSSSNRSSTKVKSINLEDGVWSKLSERIVAACVRGDKLCFSDRKAVIQKIVEYMIDTLKNTTRSKAHEIATILCNTYPKTFADTIGNDEMWGSGLETVRLEIYNACLYKINSKKRKSFSKATNYDSDDAEQEERQQQATSRRQDEYGCVEYASILLYENAESENKRRTLLELFALHEINPQVLKLMEETYPTLRAVLNDKSRNLEIIAAEWPFLQETDCFFQHCSRLLGKNVVQVWTNSLSNKTKSIRQYFKHSQKKKQMK